MVAAGGGGHVWLLLGGGGHVWLLPVGGMHGCCWGTCMVAARGCMHGCCWGTCLVAARGTCIVAQEHVWLLGACMVAVGVCIVAARGACMIVVGGVHGIRRDMEIRSMSLQYASYWNAFLLLEAFIMQVYC